MNTEQEAPTLVQLQKLAELCSDREWDFLITSARFLDVVQSSLSETEKWMSDMLGRKISITQPSVKNPGDEKL